MSRTPWSCGRSRRATADACCCGSRTTTGRAAVPSTTRPCSTIWIGWASGPDLGPVRQSDADAPYLAAAEALRAGGRLYGCDCTRLTFRTWAETHGRPWSGHGCPGGCRDVGVVGRTWRVAIGSGHEAWDDRLAGRSQATVAAGGDLVVRDRDEQWTYGFSVVVDDLRQGVDLVVRGRDLLEATADQIRLGRLLGRADPPAFAHHALVLRPDGSKLSKADGATGIRELRAAGWTPAEVIAEAKDAIGFERLGDLRQVPFGPRSPRRGPGHARRSGERHSAASIGDRGSVTRRMARAAPR